MTDISVIYYTANKIPEQFANHTRSLLIEALGEIPIISVSHKPMEFGDNIVVDLPRSQFSIYTQAFIGAKSATTKYIAMCEDDILYSPKHFEFRPKDEHWGYNMNSWNIYTWEEPVFSYKAISGRRSFSQLVCDRQMFINHMEERFSRWTQENFDVRTFGEPGKYDNQLGTTPYPCEYFYINPPNIIFSHESGLQFKGLGKRKALGQIRATVIPYWGSAKDIQALYYD